MKSQIYVDVDYLENKIKPFIDEISQYLKETISVANNIVENNKNINSSFKSEIINIKNQINLTNENMAERKNTFENIIDNYKKSDAMVRDYVESIAGNLKISINNKESTGTVVKSDNILKKSLTVGLAKDTAYAIIRNSSSSFCKFLF